MTAIVTMISSVRAAFCACGCLKAVTPFEIDSVPVRATEPEAKALSTTKMLSAPAPRRERMRHGRRAGTSRTAHFPMPTASVPYRTSRKPYVGNANRKPDSRTPRRFPSVRSTMQPSESATRCDSSPGTAEVSAKTPAATETATVST